MLEVVMIKDIKYAVEKAKLISKGEDLCLSARAHNQLIDRAFAEILEDFEENKSELPTEKEAGFKPIDELFHAEAPDIHERISDEISKDYGGEA